MNELGSERSKPWDIYTSSDPAPSQTGAVDREAPWKSFGTSMNAISFGFVATAILVSMFLIMAIFEHLFRPTPPFSSPQEVTNGSAESGPQHKLGNPQTVSALRLHFKLYIFWFFDQKEKQSQGIFCVRASLMVLRMDDNKFLAWWQVPAAYASDFSVVMPGQKHPTCIAQPAPLPCPRERVNWPSHEQIAWKQ